MTKLKLKMPQRVVEYFGLTLTVPNDTQYLAMSLDGSISAHYDHPWTAPNFWEGYELGDVAVVEPPEGLDWTSTVKQYPPEKY